MGAAKSHSRAALSEFRVEHALAHEIPYWDFTEGAVVLADGSLVKPMQLFGRNIETLDSNGLNQLSLDVRSFINSLPDNTELSFVVDVNSDCGEVITRHLEKADSDSDIGWVARSRAELLSLSLERGELVKSDLYLFIYQRPEADPDSKTSSLLKSFFRSPSHFQSMTRAVFERRLHSLEQTQSSLIQSLSITGVEARPIGKDQTWQLIYRFLNPRRSMHLSAPKQSAAHRSQEFSASELAVAPELSLPSPREQLLCSDLIVDEDSFALDGVHHRILTLKTLPEFTHSALVVKLLNLPFHYTLHCHVQVPRQSNELAQLQAKRRMAHSMSVSHGGRATDLDSEAQLSSTEDLLRELINTGQKILYTQIAMILRADSRDGLELQTRAVLAKFRELNGAEGIAESVAALPAWKTVLPCGTSTMLRAKRIKTDNLADFLPIYQDYTGEGVEPVCLFRNRSGGLIAYDPFDSKKLPNFNSLVTGSSGSGKSFLNNLILLQYMTQKPRIFVIDIGGSYRKLCEFLGGQYVEICPPSDGAQVTSINPMLLPEGDVIPSPQKLKFLLAMLENIFAESDGGKLSKLERSLLEETLIRVYETSPCIPTLSDVAKALANSPEKELKSFSKILFPWTGQRPYGRMLDEQNSLNLQSDFIVFDLKGLSAYPDLQSVMLLIITDFILGNVENLNARGRRKQILMDECWELLKSPASSSFMEYCVRTLRKSGSGITFITQGLDEIVASPIGSAIIANCATKFLLLQRGDLEPIRRILKLNDQEMALVGSLRQQKGSYSEAFMIFNEDRAVIRAVPSAIEYWLATSDSADNAVMSEERIKNPLKPLREIIREQADRFPMGYANSLKTKEAA